MKLKLSVIVVLVVQVVFGQKRERVEFKIDDLYQGVYSEVYEQPLVVT